MRGFVRLCLVGLACGSLACSGTEVDTQEPTAGAGGSAGATNMSSGGSNGAATAPPDLGHTCADPINLSGCSDGLECLESSLIGQRICSKFCDVDADCPMGSICVGAERNDPRSCTPLCASDSDCEALASAKSCRPRSEISTTMACAEK